MEKKILSLKSAICFLTLLLAVVWSSSSAMADWQKMNMPPDIDKADHQHGDKPTCWMADASNILAGAGYGDGNNVQQRADDIYMELWNHLVDGNSCGWTDTAISKWLLSTFNTWNTNPYKVVTTYGSKNPRPPWANVDLPRFVGNLLRSCDTLGLSIRQPTCDTNIGKGGHAITAWGDGNDANDLTGNPDKVKVSDSDYWDISQNVQTYSYDDYNNPNPGECNEGKGWYFNYYKSNHWYIDGIVVLSPADGNDPATQKLTASTKVQYSPVNDTNATSLFYWVSSDHNILSYRTDIDWDVNSEPNINEDPNGKILKVSWNLSSNPVPKNTWVNITAEIVIAYDANGSSITINNVFWGPLTLQPIPGAGWWGGHHQLAGGSSLYAPNMSGGYVVCGCNIYLDPGGSILVGEYRWLHEYVYYENPEIHELIFVPSPPSTYFAGNFRFGHSYCMLLDNELQQFSQWRTYESTVLPMSGPRSFHIDWTGQLPYPKGQDFVNPVPTKCGDDGTWYVSGDINKDCYVDFRDFAALADTWLRCTDPNKPECWQ